MSSASKHRKATGVRRASDYKPVEKLPVDSSRYPARTPGLIASIHDVAYYQGLLSNADNFASESRLEALQVWDGKAEKHKCAGEQECLGLLEGITLPGSRPSLQVIFCDIERASSTSFGSRLSTSLSVTLKLVETIGMSPYFLGSMLGKPEYWAPGDFAMNGQNGAAQSIEFFCQHPRWHLHKQDLPWSTYMSHDFSTKSTSYLVVSNGRHSRRTEIEERLMSSFNSTTAADLVDPFMLHTLILYETFVDGVSVITPLRHQLYDQLDKVDEYASKPAQQRGKAELEELTIQLHVVSQEIDSMTANVDMTSMIVRRMLSSHARYRSCVADTDLASSITKTADALRYLDESVESQRRWLVSYKSRKDIAMNLVFNLVTQQDAVTSTTIAREAKADGTSMKVIATLTMIFLPGTFLSSVFGMSMMDDEKWWMYVALTLPLTLIIIGAWWTWSAASRFSSFWRKMRAGSSQPREAAAIV